MRRTCKKLLLCDLPYLLLFETTVIILALTGLCGCTLQSGGSLELQEAAIQPEETSSGGQEPEVTDTGGNIFVYVCGEVGAPGVYELPPDSRMFEAIEAAGGMTKAAARTHLNQAEKLSDGQQVYVPSEKELSENKPSGGGALPEEEDGKVNLNTAAEDELMTLSGIGEVKAKAIIRYREDKGGFTSIEELKEIEGIKEGVFNKVKDHIKI